MSAEWIYLLKVNVGIALFYAFYKLFCCRDTFFHWRRMALLSFLVVSFIYPFFNVRHWVQEQSSMSELAGYYAAWIHVDELQVADTTATFRMPDAMTLLTYFYMAGVMVFALRFLIQLSSIFRQKRKGKQVVYDGIRVVSLPTPTHPFSFFRWIFVYLPDLQGEGGKEILTHELTHVRQRHSFDVIFSELINIVCWINPFMWLLKTEIRLNLEYLADNKVAESLCNTKQYQYHLLGLANQNRQTGLYNNFNVSHLKNRIVMMNKKRTRMTGRIKYALFAPLAAALLLVSNIETVARTTVHKAENVASVQTDAVLQDTTKTYQVVEQMPEFPGGMPALMKWLQENMKYPKEAQEKNEQGRVIIQFVVEKDGTPVDIKIVRGVSPSIDAEALRIVGMMPKWKPGMQKGEPVRVKYTIPLMFNLGKEPQGETVVKRVPEADENGIYRVADDMPEFPEGMAKLMEWIKQNLRYPASSKETKEQGRVIVQFVVEKDGRITNSRVARSISPALDAEALRLIDSMPAWKPAKVSGEAVRCWYTIPVSFVLQ